MIWEFGVTKRQMKGLMAVEALILSLTGALIGLVLGACFGWIGVLALPLEETFFRVKTFSKQKAFHTYADEG